MYRLNFVHFIPSSNTELSKSKKKGGTCKIANNSHIIIFRDVVPYVKPELVQDRNCPGKDGELALGVGASLQCRIEVGAGTL